MATYNGFNKALNRVVMRGVTEAQKAAMEKNPSYKAITFQVDNTAPVLEPVAVEKKVKAAPAPLTQDGATAQPEGTGE